VPTPSAATPPTTAPAGSPRHFGRASGLPIASSGPERDTSGSSAGEILPIGVRARGTDAVGASTRSAAQDQSIRSSDAHIFLGDGWLD
ncbi:MAG: hypothetical protein ACRD6W_18005, partial [Nitrososphaerales archaeon]